MDEKAFGDDHQANTDRRTKPPSRTQKAVALWNPHLISSISFQRD